MLKYAKSLIGKPFSNAGMARSIIYPRQTTGTSFFCAELVAAILQRGGLMCAPRMPPRRTPAHGAPARCQVAAFQSRSGDAAVVAPHLQGPKRCDCQPVHASAVLESPHWRRRQPARASGRPRSRLQPRLQPVPRMRGARPPRPTTAQQFASARKIQASLKGGPLRTLGFRAMRRAVAWRACACVVIECVCVRGVKQLARVLKTCPRLGRPVPVHITHKCRLDVITFLCPMLVTLSGAQEVAPGSRLGGCRTTSCWSAVTW